MQLQRAMNVAREAMGDRVTQPEREPGYILHHGLRVAKISLNLADTVEEPIEVSREVLEVGGLFHDVGKGDAAHHESGARQVRHLLKDACDPEELEQVAELVRRHNRRNTPGCSVAQRIVQDADVLDHFGAMSVWMAFHWNAAHDDPPQEWLTYYEGADNQRYIESARASLNFGVSVEAFDRRLAIEQRFLEEFRQELDGRL
jgi:uncharacterized protein